MTATNRYLIDPSSVTNAVLRASYHKHENTIAFLEEALKTEIFEATGLVVLFETGSIEDYNFLKKRVIEQMKKDQIEETRE